MERHNITDIELKRWSIVFAFNHLRILPQSPPTDVPQRANHRHRIWSATKIAILTAKQRLAPQDKE